MIIFGCSDVGPAKYLVQIANTFCSNAVCISNKPTNSIFKKMGIRIVDDISSYKDIKLVVTGTSLGSISESVDKKLICWAKNRNIPTVSIVEHWSWYRKRFETEKGLMLPDYIIVNDMIALESAVAEGLPKNIINALGNPYLENISKVCVTQSSLKELKIKYNLPTEKRLVFFVSEELKASFNNTEADDLGYDEYEVLKGVCSRLLDSDHLVIKMHPEEDKFKYKHLLNNKISILKKCPLTDMASLADIVVGMASMLLLELSIFSEEVISYRPNPKKEFIGDRLGVTVPVTNADEFYKAVTYRRKCQNNFSDRFNGSRDRIIKFLNKVAL